MSNQEIVSVVVGIQGPAGIPVSGPQSIPIGTDRQSAIAGVMSGIFAQEQPVISSISNNTGYVSASRPLLIKGKKLATVNSVLFGNVPAVWHWANDGELRFMPPPGQTAGVVPITITTATPNGATPLTASINFTYQVATIAGTFSQKFNASSPGAWYWGQCCMDENGTIFSSANIINSALPNLTGPAAVSFSFVPSSSPTLNVIATAGAGASIYPIGYQYPYELIHVLHSTIADSMGYVTTMDHHGTWSQILRPDLGAYITQTFFLNNSGDASDTPAYCMVHPDGDMIMLGATQDGTQGVLWKFNQRTPYALPIKRYYSGADFGFSCIGPDGNIFACDGNGILWKLDSTTLEVITSISFPSGTVPEYIILGGDRNLYLSCFAFVAGNSLKKYDSNLNLLGSVATTGFIPQQPFWGSDGNIWQPVSNQQATPGADSVVLQISPAMSVLQTITLTGSGGPTPTNKKGGLSGSIADESGALWFCADLDSAGGTVGTHQGTVFRMV